MSDFFDDILVPIFVILAIIAFVIGIIFSIGIGMDMLDCRGFSKGTGIETQWQWGCYAKVDGKWIPKEYSLSFGK